MNQNDRQKAELPLPLRWIGDLPLPRKLYLIIGILVADLVVVIAAGIFGFNCFSAVRAFVGGEGLWAKAQKNAVYGLSKYAFTGEEADYRAYLESLRIPNGDGIARAELAKRHPDLRVVDAGFIEGGNHPEDVRAMGKLFQRFGSVGPIARAFGFWTQGDVLLGQLKALGEDLHRQFVAGTATKHSITAFIERLDGLNDELTQAENGFSYAMGQASRSARSLLVGAMILGSLALGLLSLGVALFISRLITSHVRSIATAAAQVAGGDLGVRVALQSRDELGHLAESFNRMTEGLAKLDQLKNDFISAVSHELRTPLTLILAPLESLRAGILGAGELERENCLEIVHGNAIRLLQMINGLLDFSKLQAGRVEVHREPTDMAELTQSIVTDFQPLAMRKRIRLNLAPVEPAGRKVDLDRYLYERLVFNLLSNAIKFTPEGGEVSVTVRLQGDRLALSVRDTGVGIPPAELQTIFERFRQVEAVSTRRFEGTGLGLALVKEFATLMDGSVAVESTVGRGSVFRVEIGAPAAAPDAPVAPRAAKAVPVPAPLAAAASSVPPGEGGTPRPRILVAEDNPDLANYVCRLLEPLGETRVATDGEMALEVVCTWNPDLVLSDVMMPKKDGVTLCRDIKKTSGETPVVLLTALTHRDALIRGWEAGADDYLFKPFHPLELKARIQSLLRAVADRRGREEEKRRREELASGRRAACRTSPTG
jgi:signal transduction histidine kinase/AmiR/NasT family two-component response regulator